MTDMTVAEAALAAGVSERTMRRWIRDGRLAGCYKVGGRVRIPERAIHDAAEPYGEPWRSGGSVEDPRFQLTPAPSDLQIRRAIAAFERIDRLRSRVKPPAGPNDTAEAYIRDLRDGPPRWDRPIEER